jgi:glutathione S-transferase
MRATSHAQEELEVPYTIKYWERLPDQQAPLEMRALHPLGKAPMIEDDGMVIAESGAIVGEPSPYYCQLDQA